MALNVTIDSSIVSEEGCKGNTHTSISELTTESARVHGILENMGNASQVEVDVQVIPVSAFEDDDSISPTSLTDWEKLISDGVGIVVPVEENPISSDGTEVSALVEDLDPCTSYYFRLNAYGA